MKMEIKDVTELKKDMKKFVWQIFHYCQDHNLSFMDVMAEMSHSLEDCSAEVAIEYHQQLEHDEKLLRIFSD